EHEKELAAVRPQSLDGVRVPGRKEPEVAVSDVTDEDRPIRIQDGHSRFAIKHEGPFVGGMPVQFAIASRSQTHGHACHVLRGRWAGWDGGGRKVALGPSPAWSSRHPVSADESNRRNTRSEGYLLGP